MALFGERLVAPAEVRPSQSVALSHRVISQCQQQSADFRNGQREQFSGSPFLSSSHLAVWRVTAR